MDNTTLDAAKAFMNDVFVAAGITKQRRPYTTFIMDDADYFSKDIETMKGIADILTYYIDASKLSPETLFTVMLSSKPGAQRAIWDLNNYVSKLRFKYFVPTLKAKEEDKWLELSIQKVYKYIAIFLKLSNVVLDCSDIENIFNMRLLSIFSHDTTEFSPDNGISFIRLLCNYGGYKGLDWSFATDLPTMRPSITSIWPGYGDSTPDFNFALPTKNPINQSWFTYLPQTFIDIEFVTDISDSFFYNIFMDSNAARKFSELSKENKVSAIIATFPPAIAKDKDIACINTLFTVEQVILKLLNNTNNIQLYDNRGFKFLSGSGTVKNKGYGLVFFLAKK